MNVVRDFARQTSSGRLQAGPNVNDGWPRSMAQTTSAVKFATNNRLILWKDQDEKWHGADWLQENRAECTRGEANSGSVGFPDRHSAGHAGRNKEIVC